MEGELTLSTLKETIQNIHDLEKINFDDISVFMESEVTAEVAEKYIDMMVEVKRKLSEINCNKSEKIIFEKIFLLLATKFAESDCKSLLLKHSSITNKKYKELIDLMEIELQKERDEHNELRKKHSEELKPAKVELPGISVSLTVKENKILNSKECVEISNVLLNESVSIDEKFRRHKVPEEYKNKVERVYAKKNDGPNNILQKPSKSKK